MINYHAIAFTALTATGALFLLIIIAEFFSWIFLSLWFSKKKPGQFAFEHTDEQLKSLYGATDLGSYKEMLHEYWIQVGQLKYVYEPLVEFGMQEFNGKHITVSPRGFRHVENQCPEFPSQDRRNIFVYGGSTTYGAMVKNEETIPSIIQKTLNEKSGANTAVYNFGAGGYYSTPERIRFEKQITAGIVPDVAIFIDGLNEFYFFEVPDITAWSPIIDSTVTTMLEGRKKKKLADASNTCALISAALKKTGIREAAGNKRAKATEEEIRRAAGRLAANWEILRGICSRLGVRLVLVHEPISTYHYDASKRIVQFTDKYVGRHVNSARGYEIVAEQSEKNLISNDNVLWLQDLAIEQNQYVDHVHYSPMYSRAIGEKIAAYIIENKML